MKLLFDLKEILYKNKDKEHKMRIIIEPYEVKVELIYNPEETDFDEKIVIPIVYDCYMEFAYIPDDEYREKFKASDYGMNLDQIKLCYDIMSCLELHGKEITEYCYMLGLENRDFTTCDGKCGYDKCCKNNTEDDLK